MSQEHADVGATDNLPDEAEQPVWEEQTDVDMDECRHGVCKNVEANVGLQGLVDDVGSPAGTDDDLAAAWNKKLEREGKQNPGTTSVRDLVFGSSEPK
jgi:hypothetical protein